MPNTHEILTELVNNVSRIDRGVESFAFPTSEAGAIKARETAIADATKQINQQQRERVEKLEKELNHILTEMLTIGAKAEHLGHYVSQRLGEIRTALIKLEAEDG